MIIQSITSIAAVLMMGAVSPGPSFISVARNAISHSRMHGLGTALGTGTGAAIFALMAMLGLQKILNDIPELYLFLKLAGGAYLIWLAFRIFRGASQPISLTTIQSSGSKKISTAYREGLLTQLSNPKTAVVFASIFTALLPATIPPAFYYIIPLMSFAIDAGWFAIVALILSSHKPRQYYIRLKGAIDRVTATVLTLLGCKLIFTSLMKP